MLDLKSESQGKLRIPWTKTSPLMVFVSVVAVGACAVAGFMVEPGSLWGLVPILLYAGLCLWGLNIVVATGVALLAGFALLQPAPVDVGELLSDSLSNNVTVIGLIIILGAGLGEVLNSTGVAQTLVRGVMGLLGERSRFAVIAGMMAASLITVFMLGTLAGALAIVAPILIPIAARMKVTRTAMAVTLMYGGCAGLALAPFAGSNIAIMQAAEVSYLQYLLYGAGPLAILSVVLGLFIIFMWQKRTELQNDFYDLGPAEEDVKEAFRRPRAATIAFSVTLIACVVYATWNQAGTSFPLLALPLIAVVTGLVAGQSPAQTLVSFYRGAGAFIHLFFLFWMLSALFDVIDKLAPFQTIFDHYSTELSATSPFVFAVIVGLVGLAGVPGASAAVVVLVDQVFGAAAAEIGLSSAAWVVVLLFASKGDTYGPFPNPNMVCCMGMARYEKLRYMLLSGWMLLVPATLMYAVILYFLT